MDNYPIEYERWREKKGEYSWIECPVMVEDKVRQCEIVIKKAAEGMALAIAGKLFESGAKVGEPNVEIINRPIEHRWVFNADVRTEYECLPEQYTYMAYNMWQREYNIRVEWENKSLWQYVKHWLKRLLR